MKIEVTPEVIEALRTLRHNVSGDGMSEAVAQALVILDNAGVFSAIDEATGYDIDPAPEKVSKCTCPRTYGGEFLRMGHRDGCSGDPAEWGDMAYTVTR